MRINLNLHGGSLGVYHWSCTLSGQPHSFSGLGDCAPPKPSPGEIPTSLAIRVIHQSQLHQMLHLPTKYLTVLLGEIVLESVSIRVWGPRFFIHVFRCRCSSTSQWWILECLVQAPLLLYYCILMLPGIAMSLLLQPALLYHRLL